MCSHWSSWCRQSMIPPAMTFRWIYLNFQHFHIFYLQSSLVQLLLGELPVQSGNVIMNGSVSYAAQKPWLFTGTVRANILFGQVYDKKRYGEVSFTSLFQ